VGGTSPIVELIVHLPACYRSEALGGVKWFLEDHVRTVHRMYILCIVIDIYFVTFLPPG